MIIYAWILLGISLAIMLMYALQQLFRMDTSFTIFCIDLKQVIFASVVAAFMAIYIFQSSVSAFLANWKAI
jgi:hypothetical protein